MLEVGAGVHFNLATTVSLCAATTCASLGVLGAYLGRSPASRHFRFAAAAGVAAAAYCVLDAALASELGVAATVWAGRLSLRSCRAGRRSTR
jgi:hypothetical protein